MSDRITATSRGNSVQTSWKGSPSLSDLALNDPIGASQKISDSISAASAFSRQSVVQDIANQLSDGALKKLAGTSQGLATLKKLDEFLLAPAIGSEASGINETRDRLESVTKEFSIHLRDSVSHFALYLPLGGLKELNIADITNIAKDQIDKIKAGKGEYLAASVLKKPDIDARTQGGHYDKNDAPSKSDLELHAVSSQIASGDQEKAVLELSRVMGPAARAREIILAAPILMYSEGGLDQVRAIANSKDQFVDISLARALSIGMGVKSIVERSDVQDVINSSFHTIPKQQLDSYEPYQDFVQFHMLRSPLIPADIRQRIASKRSMDTVIDLFDLALVLVPDFKAVGAAAKSAIGGTEKIAAKITGATQKYANALNTERSASGIPPKDFTRNLSPHTTFPRVNVFSGTSLVGGAAFKNGIYVHAITPRTNFEIYGKAITRSPEEAKGILQKLGFDKHLLDEYHFIPLDDTAYTRRVEQLGGHFDATYGNIASGVKTLSFKDNIQSTLSTGETKIPVYVRKDVFSSDEAIAQVLSHEISEIEELKYLAHQPIRTQDYFDLIRPDKANNLHFHAVSEGDEMLIAFRGLLTGER